MKTESPHVHRVERVDDIPVLLATLQRLNVAEILDRHFPSGHRWKGTLTFGEVACVWIAFITSQGDHRLCQLQPWAQDNLHTEVDPMIWTKTERSFATTNSRVPPCRYPDQASAAPP